MKVIFLDIDGVLNSYAYYENMESEDMLANPIDRICVERLSRIVKATDAKIVLSSSWRVGWNKNPDLCDEGCKLLNKVFSEYNLEIYDRTPALRDRPKEIHRWLLFHPFTKYLILDDADIDWNRYKLKKHLIKTDFEDGALKEKHVEKAIAFFINKLGDVIWLR